METKFNFKSAICTSRSQSEKLLTLGLKKETADMALVPLMEWDDCTAQEYFIGIYTARAKEDVERYNLDCIPAWSLHRLIEMMPRCIKCRNSYDYADLYVNFDLVQYRFYDTDYMHDVCYEHFNDGNVYSNVIECIEWLIKEGYFNKEYLDGND